MKTLLLIDVSTLIYAAKYVKSDNLVDKKGNNVKVVYNFYNQLINLLMTIDHDYYLLCFDSNTSIRREEFAGYKQRDQSTDDEDWEDFNKQRNYIYRTLRAINLPSLRVKGFEADDTMAYFSKKYKTIIASNDGDMLQCLSPTCLIYKLSKKEFYTHNDFFNQRGIKSSKYGIVKSISGCKTDTVPGVPGIGETLAIQYLLGKMKKETKRYRTIQENKPLIKRNRNLIILPHKKFPEVKLPEFSPHLPEFVKMCHHRQFRSFLARLEHIERTLFTL